MHSVIKQFIAAIALIASACTLEGGSATWNLNPVNNHWNKAANWTPTIVPYGENDVATFATSNITDVRLGITPNGDAGNILGGIVFGAGASAYTITMTAVLGQTSYLAFYGAGITNNSGITQSVTAAKSPTSDSARIYFENSSSAGENVVITNQASTDVPYGAFTSFDNVSTAASATIINEGATVSGTMWGGFTDLLYYSNAESAIFINNPGSVSGAAAGHTLIQTQGDLGTSTFISNAASVPGAEGGWTEIDFGTTNGVNFIANGATLVGCQGGQVYAFGAGYGTGEGLATYTANGGHGNNAEGGLIDVLFVPANAQTIVRANGGTNGGLGGTILIEDSADIPLPQFQVFGNGVLDLTNVTDPTMPIGSLAGNGMVLLAGHSLSIGNNNLSTTFSGVIQESGGLTKAGTGTLTLTGGNAYTGATSVTAGTLRVTNQTSSATGTGPVKATAGTLGGSGIIAGKVTIGDGSATPAFVEPSVGANTVAQLTIQRLLTFKADGTYIYKLNTNNARADQVIAKGVTIEAGAQFNFQAVANRQLTIGTVFTAINNTSANPITGTFANLPDNSTFTAGRNNYQVSYEGGDGNDLTLTVVP